MKLRAFYAALIACLFSTVSFSGANVYTNPYTFVPLAGDASVGSQDGSGNAARFAWPMGAAIDRAGNLYIADEKNHTIRKVTPAGVVTTLAGTRGVDGFADGAALSARFRLPKGVAVDGTGNVYVADAGNGAIRKISTTGDVSTLAGNGQLGSADGAGATASFYIPAGIAVSSTGDLFVTDAGNNTIRKVTASGVVSTFTGTAGVFGKSDGVGSSASFFYPYGIAMDANGTLYVTELGNYLIRKITADRTVTTLAGREGRPQQVLDGAGSAASFRSPTAIALDPVGNAYITDMGSIRKMTTAGVVTTIAGTASTTTGWRDGASAEALFDQPSGIAVEVGGDLLVSDRNNFSIRKVSAAGQVSTFAGLPPANSSSSVDAVGSSARFSVPQGMAVAPTGEIYVADSGNHTIRKIDKLGAVTTFAGKAHESGSADGVANEARFKSPTDVVRDAQGNFYVSDSGNLTIRKISPAGTVTTFAGKPGVSGYLDGAGGEARFDGPTGLAIDRDGTLFVCEYPGNRIRKISSSGVVSTFVGGSVSSGLMFPRGICVDAGGNVFVADSQNNRVVKITPAGAITTLAGSVGVEGFTDGKGTAAQFFLPRGVAVDSTGNVFVTDPVTYLVRRIAPDGTVTTLAGSVDDAGSASGKGATARFSSPFGITLDSSGVLYVSNGNTNSNTVVRGVEGGRPLIVTQPRGLSISAGAAAQFSVVVQADPSPVYQWYFNGTPISGATSATYAMTSAQATNAGDYTVTATNSSGSVTSEKATLVVNAVTPPPVTPPASGGGTTGSGGGGGSPSVYFLAIISALGALRRLSQRK